MRASTRAESECRRQNLALLEGVVQRFEQAWARGARPRLGAYLGATLPRHALLIELLHIDLEYRLKAGEAARVEDYLERFPELAAERTVVLDLLATEYEQRQRREPGLALDEYRQRFPELCDDSCFQPKIPPPPRPPLPLPEGPPTPPTLAPRATPGPAPEEALPPATPVGWPRVAGYEILGVLGRGGMGVVYKARQLRLNRVVALKMILTDAQDRSDLLARFRLETEAVARLQHPNIVQIHEVGEADGRPFFSLEFCPGGSLETKLGGTPLPPGEAARLAETLARAVQAAHEAGVIHRDLKPANVLLAADGTPKIADFGLAKHLDSEAGQTCSGAIVGTPPYMAPEQAAGRGKEVGPLADVYALGTVLYELLTGRPPFTGQNSYDTLEQVRTQEPVSPRWLQPRVPRDLETVCLKCLQKETHKRYASALALADDLHHFLQGEPIRARPVSWWERGVKWARRRPAAAALALMSTLTAVSLTLAGVLSLDQRARAAEAKAREVTQAQQLVLEGQQAFARGDWQGANLSLTSALRIDPGEPLLEEVHKQAEALRREAERSLAEQKAREETLARYHNDFLPRRDRALFHATLAAGADQPVNVKAAREAARDALALFAVRPQNRGPLPLDAALTAEDRQQILAGCYELLLVLADADAEALPGERPEDQVRQALRALDRAASLGYPGHPTRAYHLRRGRYLEQLGDRAGANDERQKAAARPPGTALDHYLLGDEHYRQGDVAEAARDFSSALKLQADHFWARYFLAVCDLMQERPADARAELNVCLRQQPRLPWLYVLRGFAGGQLGEFQAAQDDFEQALKLEPGEDAAYALYANRGVLWFQQGKLDRAADDLLQAVRLKPKEYEAYVPLAQVYQKQGRRDEAVAQLDRAIDLEPGLAFLYRLRARLHLERGDCQAALRDADRAIAAEKPSGDAATLARDYAEKGRILYHCRKYQEAVAAYDDALKVQPAHLTAHLGRADAELKLRQYPEAVHSLDVYLKNGGKPLAAVFQARGLARSQLGDQAGAIEDDTVALTLNPADPGALHLARGWAYLARLAPQLALADFDEATRLEPGDGAAYTGRGSALIQLGRYQQAVEDAERALTRGPGTAALVYDAARIYAQAVGKMDADRGRRPGWFLELRSRYQDRALESLGRALQLHPAAERSSFWRQRVVPDAALVPIRQSPGFVRLETLYAGRTSAK